MLTAFDPTGNNLDGLKQSLSISRGSPDAPREFALVREGDKNSLLVGPGASKLAGPVAEDAFGPANAAGQAGAQRRVIGEVVWTATAPFMSFTYRAIAVTGAATLLGTVYAALGGQGELALGLGMVTTIAGLATRDGVREQQRRAGIAFERVLGAGVNLNRVNYPPTTPVSEFMVLPGPY
jgi:hypothetical protein